MFRIDTGNARDLAFVIDSWRQSFWDAPAMRGMLRDEYFREQEARIYRLLAHPAAKLKVARDEQDAELVLGWALLEPPVLHYVLVRKALRGNGIARALLANETIDRYSHRSKHLDRFPAGWHFNPFILEST